MRVAINNMKIQINQLWLNTSSLEVRGKLYSVVLGSDWIFSFFFSSSFAFSMKFMDRVLLLCFTTWLSSTFTSRRPRMVGSLKSLVKQNQSSRLRSSIFLGLVLVLFQNPKEWVLGKSGNTSLLALLFLSRVSWNFLISLNLNTSIYYFPNARSCTVISYTTQLFYLWYFNFISYRISLRTGVCVSTDIPPPILMLLIDYSYIHPPLPIYQLLLPPSLPISMPSLFFLLPHQKNEFGILPKTPICVKLGIVTRYKKSENTAVIQSRTIRWVELMQE